MSNSRQRTQHGLKGNFLFLAILLIQTVPYSQRKAIILICYSRRSRRRKLEAKGKKKNKRMSLTPLKRSRRKRLQYPKLLLTPVEGKNSRGKAKSYEIRAHELPHTPLENESRLKATLTPKLRSRNRGERHPTPKAIKALQREVHSKQRKV